MNSTKESVKMNGEDMLACLKVFSGRLHELHPNEQFKIVLVGAAALAIPKIIKRRSEDVDYTDYTRNREINEKLNKVAVSTAEQLNADSKWLNSDFTKSPSGYAIHFSEKNTYLLAKGPSLEVHSVTPIAAYCMKIMSYREKDKDDIKRLERYLSEHNVTCMNVVEIFESLYSQQFDQYLTDEQFALVVHNEALKHGTRGDWSEYSPQTHSVINLSGSNAEQQNI